MARSLSRERKKEKGEGEEDSVTDGLDGEGRRTRPLGYLS